MREIVLDTETTGLSPAEGHRIVEIGALELLNHVPTGQTFHRYLDPGRDMPKEAEAVHGLSSSFLKGKPKFADVVADLLAFIDDASLVIHNASFDMAFINAELTAAGHVTIGMERVTDTLLIARRKHPMAQNSLDALCKRYGIDTARREKHGALLDSELLAAVYLELVGGRQRALGLTSESRTPVTLLEPGRRAPQSRPRPLAARLTEEERLRHQALVESLGPDALWLKKP